MVLHRAFRAIRVRKSSIGGRCDVVLRRALRARRPRRLRNETQHLASAVYERSPGLATRAPGSAHQARPGAAERRRSAGREMLNYTMLL